MRKKHKSKKSNISKNHEEISKYAGIILTGTILVIDPSSGSNSSMPGYAIFQAGKKVESGIIQVPLGEPLGIRLQYINECLKNEFISPDLFIIEDIPSKGYGTHAVSHATLLKAVGAFMAGIRYDKYLEIHPHTWRAYALSLPENAEGYNKTDEMDAIMMGECVIQKARELIGVNKCGKI